MRAYPEGLREAFNIEEMGTPEGFLDSQVFSLAPLAFFPILACAGAIAGAEERQTLDILLGKVSEDLEDLRPASVFYYYGTAIKDGIDWANFAGVTLAALFFVLLGVLAFSRRDIYT